MPTTLPVSYAAENGARASLPDPRTPAWSIIIWAAFMLVLGALAAIGAAPGAADSFQLLGAF